MRHTNAAILIVLFYVLGLLLQGQASGQDVKPFVGPDEVRYVYSIAEHPEVFDLGSTSAKAGYVVLMHGKAKGTVEAKSVGCSTHYYIVTPEGKKVVYKAAVGERLLWTADPLPLYECQSGPKKGWIYVVPPFRGVMVDPPKAEPKKEEPKAQPSPAPPSAQPPQVMPTRFYTLQRK